MGLIETNSSDGWHYDMANFSMDFANQSSNATTMADSGKSVLQNVAKVVMMSVLVVIMFSMGCQISFSQLKAHLRRPLGIAVGAVSQFVLLPLAAFGVGHALQLPPLQALGMLVMNCCPGGAMSNIFTYWLDGDVPLSVSMTTINTALSVGMMPFNLWVYGRFWTTNQATIPYRNIAEAFILVVVPVTAGMLLKWRKPKVCPIIVKVGSIFGVLGVLLAESLLMVMYPDRFSVSWKVLVAVFIITTLAYFLGYGLAGLFRMQPPQRRTVSVETAIQNFPLCMALLTMSYPKNQLKEITTYPLMMGGIMLVLSGIFVLGFRLKQYIIRRKEQRQQQQQHPHQTNGLLANGDCEKDMMITDAAEKGVNHVTAFDAKTNHVTASDAKTNHVTENADRNHVIVDDAEKNHVIGNGSEKNHVTSNGVEKDHVLGRSDKAVVENSLVV